MIKKISTKLKTIGKNHWKKILIILILLLLIFFGYKTFLAKDKGSQYKTAKAVKQDLLQTVSASGKVKSDEEVSLKFQTSGRLAWVGVSRGDKVKKWQAIAALDKRQLEKTLKQELLDYMNERWDFEQTNLDDYKDQALTETIRRVKEKSQFDLDRVVLDVEINNIALEFATLITPIDGIVTDITTPYAGVNVTPTSAEFVIANPDKMLYSANIDEVDIGKVKPGQKAILLLDAYPDEEFTVYVNKVGFTSTTTTGGGTAFPVDFDLPANTDNEKFKLGMNGDIEIIIDERKDILTIPFETIKEDNQGSFYVYLLKDGRPEKKQVEVGFSNDADTQIVSGLNVDDQVIISGIKQNFSQ